MALERTPVKFVACSIVEQIGLGATQELIRQESADTILAHQDSLQPGNCAAIANLDPDARYLTGIDIDSTRRTNRGDSLRIVLHDWWRAGAEFWLETTTYVVVDGVPKLEKRVQVPNGAS